MDQTLNSWKRKTILFLISQCITLFGSTLVQMAIIWYVTLKTSSGIWVAAFSIGSYLPQFLISFLGGVWADRFDRKKLIMLADGAIALVTLAMFVLMPFMSSDPLLLGALLVMSVIRSLGAGIQTPAVNAVIPGIVPEAHLMRYNGINATMQSVVQFASPAAAGAILTVGTLHAILLVDVLTAVLGIGLLSCVGIPKQAISDEKASLFKDMKLGVRYAYSSKVIALVLAVYGLFVLLCVPAGFMAGLLVSREYGDTYWYLTAVELVGFAGMALGGLVMSCWGGFKSRIKTLWVGLFAFGIMAIGMGMAQDFLLYLSIMLLYGIALTMVQTATTTLLQEQTEKGMQGRVFGFMGAMYSGFLPLGMAIFGPLADAVPLQWLMIGSGMVLVLVALYVCTKERI